MLRAALITVPMTGHFKRALLVTRILRQAGIEIHSFSGAERRAAFEREGAFFHDLYQTRPMEAADSRSLPFPMRQVAFSAHYAESLAAEINSLRPDVIIYGTFSVIGFTVARILRLPSVAICAGHNFYPQRALEIMSTDPRVHVAEECWEAISVLRERYGIQHASPFLYYDTLSPHLNIIGEPIEFFTAEDRARFAPCVFSGAFNSPQLPEAKRFCSKKGLRIYVSFGTIAANYFGEHIKKTIAVINDVLGSDKHCQVRIGLGDSRALEGLKAEDSIEVIPWADQWNELQQADLHITHHGLNSTHESCFHKVPMLSYPFLGDQPFLAARCQELGIALHLENGASAPVAHDRLNDCLEQFLSKRQELNQRMEEAHQWERNAIREQSSVAQAVLDLVGNT